MIRTRDGRRGRERDKDKGSKARRTKETTAQARRFRTSHSRCVGPASPERTPRPPRKIRRPTSSRNNRRAIRRPPPNLNPRTIGPAMLASIGTGAEVDRLRRTHFGRRNLFAQRRSPRFSPISPDWARNLLNALQNLWANLVFKGRTKEKGDEAGDDAPAESIATPAFIRFIRESFPRRPRRDRLPIKEIVRYSLRRIALQAWKCGGKEIWNDNSEETPLEFAKRLRR